ncbi:hypothetical protein C8R45DRAFT_1135335 [Mycena sanguinolenta]|nr:hypothetical protein C8R45DRAFT_1135335 [Mycena sanguinolenta]
MRGAARLRRLRATIRPRAHLLLPPTLSPRPAAIQFDSTQTSLEHQQEFTRAGFGGELCGTLLRFPLEDGQATYCSHCDSDIQLILASQASPRSVTLSALGDWMRFPRGQPLRRLVLLVSPSASHLRLPSRVSTSNRPVRVHAPVYRVSFAFRGPTSTPHSLPLPSPSISWMVELRGLARCTVDVDFAFHLVTSHCVSFAIILDPESRFRLLDSATAPTPLPVPASHRVSTSFRQARARRRPHLCSPAPSPTHYSTLRSFTFA